MAESAKIEINGQTIEVPVLKGTENELALDISKLRAQTGAINLRYWFC